MEGAVLLKVKVKADAYSGRRRSSERRRGTIVGGRRDEAKALPL